MSILALRARRSCDRNRCLHRFCLRLHPRASQLICHGQGHVPGSKVVRALEGGTAGGVADLGRQRREPAAATEAPARIVAVAASHRWARRRCSRFCRNSRRISVSRSWLCSTSVRALSTVWCSGFDSICSNPCPKRATDGELLSPHTVYVAARRQDISEFRADRGSHCRRPSRSADFVLRQHFCSSRLRGFFGEVRGPRGSWTGMGAGRPSPASRLRRQLKGDHPGPGFKPAPSYSECPAAAIEAGTGRFMFLPAAIHRGTNSSNLVSRSASKPEE